MRNDPIQTALARLDELDPHTPEGRKLFAKGLSSKFNLVSAKAARIAADAQCLDLIPDLTAAFERFLSASATDKGCAALTAIARGLVTLDYDGAALFRRGAAHIQMEPVWGGSVDTAADLRAACAM